MIENPFYGPLTTHPYAKSSNLICDASVPVAVVTPPPRGYPDTDCRRIALAKATTLLAAAPRLAMALERLLGVCNTYVPNHVATDPKNPIRDLLDEAQAALTEATTPGAQLLLPKA